MPKGILDNNYANDRKIKPELIFRYKVRAQILANSIRKYKKKSENINILELGAAEGKTILYLNEILPNNKILGIEYSKELIKRANNLPPNLNLVQGDATNLKSTIENNTYDVVSALALLEHLPNPLDCIKEAKRVLCPGGIFVATCPAPSWDHIAVKTGLLKEDQHETEMTKEKMISLVKEVGLEVLNFERFMWAPISLLPYLKINISPKNSLSLDKLIYSLRIFNCLFVNQIIVAKK